MNKPNVVIADANHGLRQFGAEVMRKLGFEVKLCGDAKELREQLKSADNYLISVDLPGESGLKVAQSIWQQNPNARIIFWAERIAETCVRQALEFVPDETVFGYVKFGITEAQLCNAAEQVFLQEQCFLELEVAGALRRLQDPQLGLTHQEFEVLVDIAVGLTDRAIATRRYLSRRGVTNRLNSVYRKLQLSRDDNPAWGNTHNLRNRAVWIALQRGVLTTTLIEEEEAAWEEFYKQQEQTST